MALDDLRHNVQPHAQTGDCSFLGISGPIEPLKNLVTLLSRDAEAMIVHTDGDRLWGSVEVYLDRLCVGRILDGIAEQVGEDLSQPVSISRQASLYCATHHNGMAWIDLLHGVGDLPQQGVQVHW